MTTSTDPRKTKDSKDIQATETIRMGVTPKDGTNLKVVVDSLGGNSSRVTKYLDQELATLDGITSRQNAARTEVQHAITAQHAESVVKVGYELASALLDVKKGKMRAHESATRLIEYFLQSKNTTDDMRQRFEKLSAKTASRA